MLRDIYHGYANCAFRGYKKYAFLNIFFSTRLDFIPSHFLMFIFMVDHKYSFLPLKSAQNETTLPDVRYNHTGYQISGIQSHVG